MKRRGRDSQRSRVYRWESAVLKTEQSLSIENVKHLLVELSCKYGIRTPGLEKTKANSGISYYKTVENTIYLAPWGFNKQVVLHEFTHAVVEQRMRVPAHGRIFVGAYGHLLCTEGNIHPDQLVESLESHAIDFSKNILYNGLSEICYVLTL